MKRKTQWALIGIACMTAMSTTPVLGTTYYVAPCGHDLNSDGTTAMCQAVPPANGPKKTIQAAINVAAEGDTIIVADGTYTGTGNIDLDMQDKNLVVRSANGPDGCTINCLGNGRAFNINQNEFDGLPPLPNTSVIDGFTIINGVSTTPPYLTEKGGGILILNSSPTISNCIFRDNLARDGGAICIVADSPIFTIAPKITDCQIEDNMANQWGGGISLHSFGSCGACRSDIVISGCTIRCNSVGSGAFGGGIYVAGGVLSRITIKHSVIADNYCEEGPSGGCWGGGISGGDAADKEVQFLNVANCIIAGNSVLDLNGEGGRGGGVSWEGPGIARFANTLITQNLAGNGGGVSCRHTSRRAVVEFYDSDIVNNSAIAIEPDISNGKGGGMFFFYPQVGIPLDSYVKNSVVWNNTANNTTNEVGAQIHADSPQLHSPNVNVSYTDIQQTGNNIFGGVTFTNSIDNDPSFADWDGADNDVATWKDNNYRLLGASPAADQGSNDDIPDDWADIDDDGVTSGPNGKLPWDMDRNDRILETGLIVDMGAYERPSCTAGACNADQDLCTLNVCESGVCVRRWEEWVFGDMNDDLVANKLDYDIILECDKYAIYSNCRRGVFEGCDFASFTSACTPDGVCGKYELYAILDAMAGSPPCPALTVL